MKIINLTPHEVVLYKTDGSILKLPKAETPLRLEQTTSQLKIIDGVSFTITKYGLNNQTLPKVEEGTIYIVSKIFLKAFPSRLDFYMVNETVKDENGHIIGCKSLTRI